MDNFKGNSKEKPSNYREEYHKRMMHACFMYLMTNGTLHNERKTFNALKSILELMTTGENLSDVEYENCIVYFYDDYSKGCESPIPELYVRQILVPAIKKYGQLDLVLGATLLYIARNNV